MPTVLSLASFAHAAAGFRHGRSWRQVRRALNCSRASAQSGRNEIDHRLLAA